MKAIKDLLQRIRTDRGNRQGTWIGIDESHIILNALEKSERIETENTELRARLENAVELPCIEPMNTWDWDDTTGLGKNNFGKYWQVLYRDEDGEFIAYIGATKEEAEARLAELKGGRE